MLRTSEDFSYRARMKPVLLGDPFAAATQAPLLCVDGFAPTPRMLNLQRPWVGCRVISDLFDRMESEREGGGTYLVRCSYLEIYNEEVRDLLQPATASKQIHIRERENGDIFVSGVSEKHAPTQQVGSLSLSP